MPNWLHFVHVKGVCIFCLHLTDYVFSFQGNSTKLQNLFGIPQNCVYLQIYEESSDYFFLHGLPLYDLKKYSACLIMRLRHFFT